MTTRQIKSGVLLLAAAVLCFVLGAAEEKKPPPVIFIEDGNLHTMTGEVIYQGDILISDGKIEKIGKDLQLPEDATVIRASGKWVMPGFTAAHSASMGLYRVDPGDKKADLIYYLNPYSEALNLLRAAGVTSLSPNPDAQSWGVTGIPFSFRNLVIKSVTGEIEAMYIHSPAYLYINAANLDASLIYKLRTSLQKAKAFLETELAREESELLAAPEGPAKPPPDIRHYVQILKGELPVRFAASDASDIRRVLSIVDEFGISAQILGCQEGWMLAEEIGRRNISVILQPGSLYNRDPYQDSGGSNIQNAASLSRNGVKIAIIPQDATIPELYGGTIGTDMLTFPLAGAFAVRGGLPPEAALEALTIRAAEMLGIQHKVGSLEAGKEADIIILDGNPLDYRTYVEFTIIDGRLEYDKSKSRLFERIPKPKTLFK